jgi:hypothetical protein
MVHVSATLLLLAAACSDWRADRPLDRAASDVDTAAAELQANQVASAKKRLFAFLGHGACVDGKLDLPEATRNSREARYDLALALADLGTAFGGKARSSETTGSQEGNAEGSGNDLACAADMAEQLERSEPDFRRRLVLRALLGNIRLAEHKEQAAMDAFDAVLREIANASTSFVATEAATRTNAAKSDAAVTHVDGGTHALPKRAEDIDLKQLADDVAFNRAIALRALNKDKDGGADSSDDSSPDARSDGESPDADNPDGQGQDGASQDGQTQDAQQGDAQNQDAQNSDAQTQGDGASLGHAMQAKIQVLPLPNAIPAPTTQATELPRSRKKTQATAASAAWTSASSNSLNMHRCSKKKPQRNAASAYALRRTSENNSFCAYYTAFSKVSLDRSWNRARRASWRTLARGACTATNTGATSPGESSPSATNKCTAGSGSSNTSTTGVDSSALRSERF